MTMSYYLPKERELARLVSVIDLQLWASPLALAILKVDDAFGPWLEVLICKFMQEILLSCRRLNE